MSAPNWIGTAGIADRRGRIAIGRRERPISPVWLRRCRNGRVGTRAAAFRRHHTEGLRERGERASSSRRPGDDPNVCADGETCSFGNHIFPTAIPTASCRRPCRMEPTARAWTPPFVCSLRPSHAAWLESESTSRSGFDPGSVLMWARSDRRRRSGVIRRVPSVPLRGSRGSRCRGRPRRRGHGRGSRSRPRLRAPDWRHERHS